MMIPDYYSMVINSSAAFLVASEHVYNGEECMIMYLNVPKWAGTNQIISNENDQK